ncbi:MAG: Fic family protein [Verrucomicrobiota bacterium]
MRPPFEITDAALGELARLERLVGRFEGARQVQPSPQLRKSSRVRTIQASVEIEGNTLTEEQVTALLEGKRVIAPKQELLEIRNANAAYDRLGDWNPGSRDDFLEAHELLMKGLIERAGRWRAGGVGVVKGSQIAHVAPPADRVPYLIQQLLEFVGKETGLHPAIRAAVCHYELEFIHPFEDGNGRIGRLWHTLILTTFHPIFAHTPVESVIRDRQEEYYRVLEACDQTGASTAFIEFALRATCDAFEPMVAELSKAPTNLQARIETARLHFGNQKFARRKYLELFPGLSTATASRDLKSAVESGSLEKQGDKALARYRFVD